METSLSKLSEGEWSQISNRWARGIDWVVMKKGSRWIITGLGRISHYFPTYKTKKVAYEVVTTIVLQEAHDRAEKTAIAKAEP